MKQDIDINVSFEELLATCSADRQWLLDLIEEEVIIVEGSPEQAQFSGFQMARVRKAYRISHDFEASVPALPEVKQTPARFSPLPRLLKASSMAPPVQL